MLARTGELSAREIERWLKGVSHSCVASCAICSKITLYMIGDWFGVDKPPDTCGRMECLKQTDDPLGRTTY